MLPAGVAAGVLVGVAAAVLGSEESPPHAASVAARHAKGSTASFR
jgi:hypothetical protein